MLTAAERAAGRAWRAFSDGALAVWHDSEPPTYTVPDFLAVWRHECTGHRHTSEAIVLREEYRLSPAYQVRDLRSGELIEVPAGRFGYIYREGRCRTCGENALSRVGRVVDAYRRPALGTKRLPQGNLPATMGS